MKKGWFYLMVSLSVFLLFGCGVEKEDGKKLRDAAYVILKEEEIPEELLEMIAKKKKEPFQLTYKDQGRQYLAKGYGEQETKGYLVEVTACYETKTALVVCTDLIGPPAKEENGGDDLCPYLVIETNSSEKSVWFR